MVHTNLQKELICVSHLFHCATSKLRLVFIVCIMASMDAEFIDFLDKKFQKLSDEIQGVRTELKADTQNLKAEIKFELNEIKGRLTRIEESLDILTNTVDGFVKILEDVQTEQKMIVADIFRIKQVIKEKLGVEI